jgi:hypothetical protein
MKIAFIDGIAELEKLEKQADQVKFKFFVPRGATQVGRITRIWSTKNGPNYIVLGTSDVVALAKLPPGDHVPDDAVTCTYLKI